VFLKQKELRNISSSKANYSNIPLTEGIYDPLKEFILAVIAARILEVVYEL